MCLNKQFCATTAMKCALYSLGAVISLSTSARADLIAYEPFDRPDISQSILRQETGTGFSGPWKSIGGGTNLTIGEGSLRYPGLITGGNRVLAGSMSGNFSGLVHDLETRPDETTTKYLSFLVRPERNNDQDFGFIVESTRGDRLAIGKSLSSNGNYSLQTLYNIDVHSSDVKVQVGQTSFMVLRADLTRGIDTFTLFINPTLGEPEPATGVVKRDLDLGLIRGIGVVASAFVSVDEIRWGDSFADVTPMIPPMRGDFDQDGLLTAADINRFRTGLARNDLRFDLDGNGTVELADRGVLIEDVFGTFFGDADLNRKVEFADFLALSSNFSGRGGWNEGDFDGTGQIQFGDFLLLSSNFGRTAVAAAVPEPHGAILVLIGLAMQVRRIRKS